MNLDFVKTPFTNNPSMVRYEGIPYNKNPNQYYIKQKKKELKHNKEKLIGESKLSMDIELKKLGNSGIKNLNVICPSFVIDNLETLEEVNLRGREIFIKAGGENFNYIPCLNTNPLWLNFLEDIVKE